MGRRQAYLIPLAALVLAAAPRAQVARKGMVVDWSAPAMFIEGEPYPVRVKLRVPEVDLPPVPTWMLTPSAFIVDGRLLGKRNASLVIEAQPGQVFTAEFDMGSVILASESFAKRDFRLRYGDDRGARILEVGFLKSAEKGIEFRELPAAQLKDYQVVLRTSRGDLWLELWPHVAPNHVRHFLDLCYTGFYDGSKFHRVIPTYMIQAGAAAQREVGPQVLEPEFSTRRHVPGVISMAPAGENGRAGDEFFIMHGVAPSLDGRHSAFGQLVGGLDIVDAIANSGNKSYEPSDERAYKPPVDQTILKAIVVRAPKRIREGE